MAINNRTCCVCGHEYYYCSNGCHESLNEPSWKGSFCCENCMNVYHACSGYYAKQKTKEEAKSILDNCDLTNKHSFTPATQRLIKEIYQEDNDTKKEVKDDVSSSVEKKENTKNQYNKYNNKFKKK